MGRHRHSRKKELLVVSVHLNTGDHDKELQHLKERIQSKVAQGDFYVLLGGDFHTKNRGKAESVLLSIVDAKQPYPVDQNGVDGTNSGRTKPCDWVLCSHDWAKFEISVVMGSHSYPSYPNGHVFDSRVYEQNGGFLTFLLFYRVISPVITCSIWPLFVVSF